MLNAEQLQQFVDEANQYQYQLSQLKTQRDEIDRMINELEMTHQKYVNESEPSIMEMMQMMGIKQLKTINGDTINLKVVDKNKLSYWSASLDKNGKYKFAKTLKEKGFDEYVSEKTTASPKLKEIKEAIGNGELILDDTGKIVTQDGELLFDEPVFKLREEHLDV